MSEGRRENLFRRSNRYQSVYLCSIESNRAGNLSRSWLKLKNLRGFKLSKTWRTWSRRLLDILCVRHPRTIRQTFHAFIPNRNFEETSLSRGKLRNFQLLLQRTPRMSPFVGTGKYWERLIKIEYFSLVLFIIQLLCYKFIIAFVSCLLSDIPFEIFLEFFHKCNG